MLRLAVITDDATLCTAIAPRLRGAVLHRADDADAVAVLATMADDFKIDKAGKSILLNAHCSPSSLRPWLSRPHIAIVNPARYLPSRQLIRQQLDAGKLGAPGFVRVHRWESSASEESRLCDLDLVLWYAGLAPNIVHAVQNETATQIHLGYPGGAMALLDHARLPDGDSYQSVSVIAASGAAYADDQQNMQILYRGGTPKAVRAEETLVQWTALLQEFVDRAGKGETGSKSFPTWSDVFAVSDAVDQSLRFKQSVRLEGARNG
jgi:hypothetical protein